MWPRAFRHGATFFWQIRFRYQKGDSRGYGGSADELRIYSVGFLKSVLQGECKMPFLTWIVLGLVAGFIGSKIVNKAGGTRCLRQSAENETENWVERADKLHRVPPY